MKILEITEFSAGICGVWTRVLSESLEFKKLGQEVIICSSDIVKGTDKKAKHHEKINGISVYRFPSKADIIDKLITKNVTYFSFENKIEELGFKPDLIITHLIHPHSFKALKYSIKNGIRCYLVTHAPFNLKRNFILTLAKAIHDTLSVKPNIKHFNKVISITKWENKYLKKLGIDPNKIIYIPNGIPEEFFKQKKSKVKKDVLFLGRIAPIKDLETLIKAVKTLDKVNLSIVGMPEKGYLVKIKKLIGNSSKIKIYPPIFDLKKKIKLIDAHQIFVLPSKREAMPQALLEAMARGRALISSNTDGGKEIIQNNKTGLLFEVGNYKQLAELIKKNIKGNKKIQNNAKTNAKKYAWKKLIKLYPIRRNK